jgi:hypothetical protein
MGHNARVRSIEQAGRRVLQGDGQDIGQHINQATRMAWTFKNQSKCASRGCQKCMCHRIETPLIIEADTERRRNGSLSVAPETGTGRLQHANKHGLLLA